MHRHRAIDGFPEQALLGMVLVPWWWLLQPSSFGCCSWQSWSREQSCRCLSAMVTYLRQRKTLTADPIQRLALTAGHTRLQSSPHLLLQPKFGAAQKKVASKNSALGAAAPAQCLFSCYLLAFSYLSVSTGCKGRTDSCGCCYQNQR